MLQFVLINNFVDVLREQKPQLATLPHQPASNILHAGRELVHLRTDGAFGQHALVELVDELNLHHLYDVAQSTHIVRQVIERLFIVLAWLQRVVCNPCLQQN